MSKVSQIPDRVPRRSPLKTVQFVASITVLLTLALVSFGMFLFSERAWETGKAGVEQSKVLSEGQQLCGSLQMHAMSAGRRATSLDELVPTEYLSKVPEGWTLSEDYILWYDATAEPARLCEFINRKARTELGHSSKEFRAQDPEITPKARKAPSFRSGMDSAGAAGTLWRCLTQ